MNRKLRHVRSISERTNLRIQLASDPEVEGIEIVSIDNYNYLLEMIDSAGYSAWFTLEAEDV